MDKQFAVRRVRQRDLDRILEIERASFGADAYDRNLFAEYTRKCGGLFLVAERASRGQESRGVTGTAGATLPSSSAIPLVCSNAGQDDGRTIGEFRDKGQFSPHGLDGLAQGGQQQIAALFESRNTVLGDAEGLGHSDLRELARVAQLAQGHLLGNQLSGAGLDLLA